MRRVLCLALALCAALSLAGCSSMFDREYYAVEDFEVPAEQTEPEEDAAAISSYAALRRAVMRLVSEHAESGQLQFQNYEGTISQDISTACWEVKSSTALGAFAVDYISYDLSRIVSYYQAEIFITYKRAAWQVEAIEKAANVKALSDRIAAAMGAGETYLVLETGAAAVTGETVRDAAEEAYYADPALCPVLPAAETGLFPETGVSRILEITLDYGLDGDELAARREALSAALDAVRLAIPADMGGEAERLSELCAYLAERVDVVPGGGKTAWDALTLGEADSEGAALALEACCQALGIPCRTVVGRLAGEAHCWNQAELEGVCYHLDLTAWTGAGAVFLTGDENLVSRGYWWDTEAYPACPGPYGAEAASGEMGPS